VLRIGQGYDVHRVAEGRKLVIGGVVIPWDRGLDGHSDADVLTHAIMDAMLGAVALGDIGQHFPDTDPAFAGADSIAMLGCVRSLLQEQNVQVVNVDSTVIAQVPKLAPHISAMRVRLADAIGINESDVSVKATTHERLGPLGLEEGIAAHAVVLVEVT
jgi:2-C-methyl-D-erythritol 2,4-cyclodiphosphate synthase